MRKKAIKVTCEGADVLGVDLMTETQGELKSLSADNYARLKKVILEMGFTEPVSIWRDGSTNRIINGHQRVRTVKAMKAEGHRCPPLPVNWVKADNLDEAKRKVLALTSQYGAMEEQGLYEFLSDSDIDPMTLASDYNFADLPIGDFLANYYDKADNEETTDSAEDSQGLWATCPKCETEFPIKGRTGKK